MKNFKEWLLENWQRNRSRNRVRNRRAQTLGRKRAETNAQCPTGKESWPTEEQAQMALEKIWATDPNAYFDGPKRSYQCNMCGMWHLTSKTDNRGVA